MTTVQLWYATQGGTGFVDLMRQGNDGALQEMLTKNIPDNGNLNTRGMVSKAVTGAEATVDNRDNSYWIFACLMNGQNSVIYSARVSYTYTNAGD
jgi:hypothetical protein